MLSGSADARRSCCCSETHLAVRDTVADHDHATISTPNWLAGSRADSEILPHNWTCDAELAGAEECVPDGTADSTDLFRLLEPSSTRFE